MLTNILLWLVAGVVGAHIVDFYSRKVNFYAAYFKANPLKPLRPEQIVILTAMGPVSLWLSLGGLGAALNEVSFGNSQAELPESKYLGFAGPLGLSYVLAKLTVQVARDLMK